MRSIFSAWCFFPFAASVLSLGNAEYVLASSSNQSCRCLFGDTCWPSPSAFDQLQSLLSQPLLYPEPTASPCYPASTNASSASCQAVISNYNDGVFRSNIVGSMEAPNWETYTFSNGTTAACYPETNITGVCEQGNVPVVAVNASSVADIQAAIEFAVEYNLRLVVKNTGHDFIGRSAGRGAIMLWTHHLKNITYDASFVPEGASSDETFDTFTFGSGVQWFEAYAAAEEENRYLVGGISLGGSVGAAGGWVQGGGHSVFSPTYGLGVDNVVQMSVVTASGEYLTANAYQNTDLFWALRGGGGGTFGVVTSVTYLAHPLTPVVIAYFAVNSSNTLLIGDLYTKHFAQLPAMTDEGWGGYGSFSGTLLKTGMTLLYMNPNTTLAEANATWAPLFEDAAKLGALGLNVQNATLFSSPSWWPIYNAEFSSGDQNGYNELVGARLIPRDGMTNFALTTALFAIPGFAFNTIAGGQVNRIDPDSAGVNPAWRDTIVEATWGAAWLDTTPALEIDSMIATLKVSEAAIAALTPTSGCYFNEASPFESDFQKTFWGNHYDRLKSIKAQYDPNDLFIVHQGVGSENWDATLTCRVST